MMNVTSTSLLNAQTTTAEDVASQRGALRSNKQFSQAKIIKNTSVSEISKRPMTATGLYRKLRAPNKLGAQSNGSNALLQSQNMLSGTTATASNVGGIVRLSSQDGRGFELLRGSGTRSKIAQHRMSRLNKSASRPQTAMGASNQQQHVTSIQGALSSSGLASRKKNPSQSNRLSLNNVSGLSAQALLTNLRLGKGDEEKSEQAGYSSNQPYQNKSIKRNPSRRPQTASRTAGGSNMFSGQQPMIDMQTGQDVMLPAIADKLDFKTFMDQQLPSYTESVISDPEQAIRRPVSSQSTQVT